MIEREEVRHVARLARLALSDEEVDRMAVELAGVLDHIATIEQLDLDTVEPTSHVVAVENALREDLPQPSLARELVLASAPAVVDDGFAVPSPQA
ncbi:MAG: Asp-tRNA(Asn)/Glu-tRNA(Gln) amidotransferase subunit GatC [Solirubrobacteraceae bacterium]|jgi:aspartyl-tRNA(Asn)/glutamyl-tRNA(Gln) amidotransferase subunit C